jgi:hypothetical protein
LNPIAARRHASAEESMPEDRKSPSGRSATVRMRIAASKVGSHGSAVGSGVQYSWSASAPVVKS